jgi:hypothetical protein
MIVREISYLEQKNMSKSAEAYEISSGGDWYSTWQTVTKFSRLYSESGKDPNVVIAFHAGETGEYSDVNPDELKLMKKKMRAYPGDIDFFTFTAGFKASLSVVLTTSYSATKTGDKFFDQFSEKIDSRINSRRIKSTSSYSPEEINELIDIDELVSYDIELK